MQSTWPTQSFSAQRWLAIALAAIATAGCLNPGDDSASVDGQGEDKNGGAATLAHPAVGRFGSLVSQCSGVLIAPSYVLTAAHCESAVGIFVVEKEDGTRITRGAVSLVANQNYVPGVETASNLQFDIMIVKLDEPIEEIELMPLGEDNPQPAELVEIIGYGITAFGNFDSGTKRKKGVVVESIDEHLIHVVPSAEGVTDACLGDSGGAMLRLENDKVVQTGVLSYVKKGCLSTHAVSVSSWRTWIDDAIELLAAHVETE